MRHQKMLTGIIIIALTPFVWGCESTAVNPTDPPQGIVNNNQNQPVQEEENSSKQKKSDQSLPPDPFASVPEDSTSENEKKDESSSSDQKKQPFQPDTETPANASGEDGDQSSQKAPDQSDQSSSEEVSLQENNPSILFTKFQNQLQNLPGSSRAKLLRAFLHLLQDKPQQAHRVMQDVSSTSPYVSADPSSDQSPSLSSMKQMLQSMTLYRLGENQKSIMGLDEIRYEWEKHVPLQIDKALFVSSVEGFENYKRRGNRTFQPGEYLLLYGVVRHFGLNRTKNSRYTVALDTDFSIYRKEWDPERSSYRKIDIAWPSQKNVNSKLERTYDFQMRREYLVVRLQMPKQIPSGKNYYLQLKVTDTIWDKTAKETLPFEIQ